jgi:hypothetical protein
MQGLQRGVCQVERRCQLCAVFCWSDVQGYREERAGRRGEQYLLELPGVREWIQIPDAGLQHHV